MITLEINAFNFIVKIIRAGGFLNKYENYSLFELFPEVFKTKQISLMKKILLNSNSDIEQYSKIDNNKSVNKSYKNKENDLQIIYFNFIIEEKEGNDIYYQLLKLELNFALLKTINTTFYLNGVYKIDKDIIITEQRKEEEYLFHFGNKNQINIISEKPKENKFKIKYRNGNKYLGNKKLIKEEKVLTENKHYNVYHFFIQPKKNDFTRSDKNNINFLNGEVVDDKANISENQDKIIFNDVASQSSSVTSSISRNNLMLNNRGNKQVKDEEDITKNFRTLKHILWIFIFSLAIMLFLEYLVLKLFHSNISKDVNFYLSLSKYFIIYCRIFCSTLSLSCIGTSPDSRDCLYGIREFSELIMNVYNNSNYENATKSDEGLNILSLLFVNFEELLFNQEQVSYYLLETTKDYIIDYLVDINQEKYNKIFEVNLTYHKITQQFEKGELNLIIKKEKISFNDALLLMTSRFAILSKDITDLKHSIYLLNNFDENTAFTNINKKIKLNSYQENFYALLLDNNEFITYLNETVFYVEQIAFDRVNSFKKYVYIILLINVILYLAVFIILFGYMCIYLIIIFQVLKNIYAFLNEKLSDIPIKDLMKKKMDNLKMLLLFYEKDVNSTINDLNSIYHNYKESNNLKIKEESKNIKRENMREKEKETKNNNSNLFKLFKCKYFTIFFTYSTKKNIYIYSIIFLIIFIILIFLVYIIILLRHIKKQDNILRWIDLSKGLSTSTNFLMTNFLIMVFTNQSFAELSSKLPNKDYISYVYNNLKDLYEAGELAKNFQSLLLYTEKNIKYDCEKFYLNLDYPYFNLLLSKYKLNNDTDRFYFTLSFFCQMTSIMSLKNYKTIYMKLFNPILNINQNFKKGNYTEIINFIAYNNFAGIEIIFFIVYVYLLDILNSNIQIILGNILNEINNKIDILGIMFIIGFLHLIFSIFFTFTRNINNDCKNFIQMKKIFKVCNIND